MRQIIKRLLLTPNTFDSAALAYFAATGITNPVHQAAINNYIVGLKNAGIFSKITARYLTFNNATTAAINLVNPDTFQSSIIGSPTISASGYIGSASSYIRTGIIPSTHLATDSLHVGWFGTNAIGNNNVLIGCITVSLSQRLTLVGGSSGVSGFTSATYASANQLQVLIDARTRGYYMATRGTGGASAIYKNGSSLTTGNQSGTLPTHELIFDGVNNVGTFTPQSSARGYGVFTVGQFLTPTEVQTDNTLTQALITALGL